MIVFSQWLGSANGRTARWLPCSALLTCLLLSHLAVGAEKTNWGKMFEQEPQRTASAETPSPYPTTDFPQNEQNNYEARNSSTSKADSAQSSSNWMFTSPFANVSWPEIKMPKMEFRAPWSNGKRKGWFSAPLTKAKTTTQNVIGRTRTAWNDTIERMKFALPGGARSSSPNTQVASKPNRGGFWNRLMGKPETSNEPDGVVEMMAKEPTGPQR